MNNILESITGTCSWQGSNANNTIESFLYEAWFLWLFAQQPKITEENVILMAFFTCFDKLLRTRFPWACCWGHSCGLEEWGCRTLQRNWWLHRRRSRGPSPLVHVRLSANEGRKSPIPRHAELHYSSKIHRGWSMEPICRILRRMCLDPRLIIRPL